MPGGVGWTGATLAGSVMGLCNIPSQNPENPVEARTQSLASGTITLSGQKRGCDSYDPTNTQESVSHIVSVTVERSRVADMLTCHSSYAITVLLCFSLLSSSLHTACKYWQARVESYASLDQSGSLFTECVSIDCLNIGLRIL